MKRLIFILLVLCCLPTLGWSITCDQPTLKAAIDAVPNGTHTVTTIYCAAGSFTWTNGQILSISQKSIEIVGAGIDTAYLTFDTGATPITFNAGSNPGYYTFHMTGFSFQQYSAGYGSGIINLTADNPGDVPPVCCRVDHVKYYSVPSDGSSSGGRFMMNDGVSGVLDHCTFISDDPRGGGGISARNTATVGYAYHHAISFGNDDAWYTENCDLKFGSGYHGNGGFDNYYGGRYVVRKNLIENTDVGNHGPDSQPRGTRSFEVYQNEFHFDTTNPTSFNVFCPRSGTGYVWGNTVKNEVGSQQYETFFCPIYYGGLSHSYVGQSGNPDLSARAQVYFPTPPWSHFNGISGPIYDSSNNYITGSNPLDKNDNAAEHFDPDPTLTRTKTDLHTTSGSPIITCADCNFDFPLQANRGDNVKDIVATNIGHWRVVHDASWTMGSHIVTSASQTSCSPGDVGMLTGATNDSAHYNLATFGHNAYVDHCVGAAFYLTTAAAADVAVPGAGGFVLFGPSIISTQSATQATLNVPATGTTSTGTITIGYFDTGYPMYDMPGWGSFKSPTNTGSWPTMTSYSAGNFEQLEGIYLALNHWQTGCQSNWSTGCVDGMPPAPEIGEPGDEAYIKEGREYHSDAYVTSGLYVDRPISATEGDGYWATDKGGHWDSTSSNLNNGALYKYVSGAWILNYTPAAYPWCNSHIGEFGCAFDSSGVNYYVATTGSDSNAGTDPSAPWQHIQKCNDNPLAAGDICNVAAGTYNEKVQITISGTAGNVITFQATGAVKVRSIYIGNGPAASYVNVKGFEIDGLQPGGAYNELGLVVGHNSSHIKADTLTIHNTPTTGTKISGSYIWMTGIIWHDIGTNYDLGPYMNASTGSGSFTVGQDSTTGTCVGSVFNVTAVASNSSYLVTLATPPTGCTFGETIKIIGTHLGGMTPANDLQMQFLGKSTDTHQFGSQAALSDANFVNDHVLIENCQAYQTGDYFLTSGTHYAIRNCAIGPAYTESIQHIDTLQTSRTQYVLVEGVTSSNNNSSDNHSLQVSSGLINLIWRYNTTYKSPASFNSGCRQPNTSGCAGTFTNICFSPTCPTSGSGTGATFDVDSVDDFMGGHSYTVTVNASGSTYAGSNTITITGDKVGGISPDNDITVTVLTAPSGHIATISWTGVSANKDTQYAYYNNTYLDNYVYLGAMSGPFIEVRTHEMMGKNNIYFNSTDPASHTYVVETNSSNPNPGGSVDKDYDLEYMQPSSGETNGVTGVDPLFVDQTNGDYHLQAGSPAINRGGPLTTAARSGSSSVSLTVNAAYPFQDGMGMGIFGVQPDCIAVGSVGNVSCISSINYATKVITLATPISWTNGANIYLYSKSDGVRVLYGSAPDIGAFEQTTSQGGGKIRLH